MATLLRQCCIDYRNHCSIASSAICRDGLRGPARPNVFAQTAAHIRAIACRFGMGITRSIPWGSMMQGRFANRPYTWGLDIFSIQDKRVPIAVGIIIGVGVGIGISIGSKDKRWDLDTRNWLHRA